MSKKESQTVGDFIDGLTSEYIELYERMADDPFFQNMDVKGLVTLDLRNKIYMYKEALSRLEEYINNKE